jgi:HTH domain
VTADAADGHPLIDAVQPIADAVGGRVVTTDEMVDGDVELRWSGQVVGGFRLDMQGAIERLVSSVERELGADDLSQLDRVGKQHAVRLLDERGAFELRRSIDDIADRMGVSRITIYNYLNTVRG